MVPATGKTTIGSLFLVVVFTASCRFGEQEALTRFRLETAQAPKRRSQALSKPNAEPASYAGSESCRRCHTEIYKAWQSTRHSYSIMTGEQARQAGYPLPKQAMDTGDDVSIRSWADISEVIGGRKRIAYADTKGRVATTSYQHRTGEWRSFPGKVMECGPCHYTGPRYAGARQGCSPASLSNYNEINIGCEACHGPGSRHIKTFRKEDIQTDVSSRVCGTCHTAVGRILPKDQLHETHDLVQNWNQDSHVTGVRFQSHNTSCSRCHSPQDGYTPLETAETGLQVFSEAKQNITCTGCHNPHGLTNRTYQSTKVRLHAPLASPSHILNGRDGDISTNDFLSFDSANDACMHCHSGADRIDLDHANAGCVDCHNVFQFNRSASLAPTNSPDHRRVSCRQCHADGDHLLALIFRDEDFLKPSYIHNLRKLPDVAVKKHKLHYRDLSQFSFASGSESGGDYQPPQRRPAPVRSKPSVHFALLESVPFIHGVQALAPEDPNAMQAAKQLGARDAAAANWLSAYLDLKAERDTEAEAEFHKLLEVPRLAEPSRLALAVIHLRQRKFNDALARLKGVLAKDPYNLSAYYAMGIGHLRQQRPDLAIEALVSAIEIDPSRLEAYRYLSTAYRRAGMEAEATRALAQIVERQPDSFDARINLANLFKSLMDSATFRLESLEADANTTFGGELRRRRDSYAEQALAQFASALRLRSGDQSAMRQVGEIYRRQIRLQEAREMFEYLVTSQPREWLLAYRLGAVRLQLGELDRAIEQFRRAVDLAPFSGDAHAALGLAYARRGNTADAIRALREARVAEPFHPGVFINLGACEAMAGNRLEAKQSLHRATELGTFPLPKLHLAYTNIALIHWQEGDSRGARQAAQHALHIRPGFEPAQRILAALKGGIQGRSLPAQYVFHDLVEIFGEITTAEFADE
jgi:tetratricopeptide (TPR) repeat protein